MNFLKAASVCPVVTPAHPEENADEIIRLLGELSKEGIQAAVFRNCVLPVIPVPTCFSRTGSGIKP